MGLLLGQLHVNTLDEASNRAAEENKVNNCHMFVDSYQVAFRDTLAYGKLKVL